MKTAYTDADVMLTLAAITYRGWELVLPGQAPLLAAMTPCLQTLAPVKNDWDIVWGPASFTPGLVGFGDVTMYVARNRERPSRFAIAVRGTNPISLRDWVFGDLLVKRQTPWVYGDTTATPDAKISFSTALGLSILQHLRSDPAHHTASGISGIIGRLGATVAGVEAAIAGPLHRLRDPLVSAISTLRGLLPGENPSSTQAWVELVRKQRSSQEAQQVSHRLDSALQSLGATRFDPLHLILDGTQLDQKFTTGHTLQQFLAAAAAAGPIEVFVTGHSKGGALSPALALWLADTQGTAHVADSDRWNPTGDAKVFAYSFAGPTAGNDAFVQHFNSVLGQRSFRIMNRLDLVPHAWETHDLDEIPTLYNIPVVEQQLLDGLVTEIVNDVGELKYTHVGQQVTVLPGVAQGGPFVGQVIHQHLDGYFEQMGLSADMNTNTFFFSPTCAPPI